MPSIPVATGEIVTPDEIRAAVERLASDDTFSRSPQLLSFLRFVIDASLQGKADRIKAYTIGIEVLRRDSKFDPQIDPIVRVEATRLRRALEAYYNGPGVNEPIVISLPRGTYVPSIQRRPPPTLSLVTPGNLLKRRHDGSTLRKCAVVAVATIVCGVIALYFAGIGPFRLPSSGTITAEVRKSQENRSLSFNNGLPNLLVKDHQPAEFLRGSSAAVSDLIERLRDAFSRFETVNIVGDPVRSDTKIDYEFSVFPELEGIEISGIRFRLIDASNDKIIWTEKLDWQPTLGEDTEKLSAIVGRIATTLHRPFGVIRSHDWRKHLSGAAIDTRYSCILIASNSIRMIDPKLRASAIECLERLTETDGSFAAGYSFLGVMYAFKFHYELDGDDRNRAMIDKAQELVVRGAALNPTSARAHQFLMITEFIRGEYANAFEAGERGIALNSYDLLLRAHFAGFLILAGQRERGMELMRAADEAGTLRLPWDHFHLFVAHYMDGNFSGALQNANRISAPDYPPGYLAKALGAAAAGDLEQAVDAYRRLVTLFPAWRRDLRRQLDRYIADEKTKERFVNDLAAIERSGRI